MGQQVSKRARGDRHRYGKVRLFNLRERGDLLMRKPVAITLQYTSMSNHWWLIKRMGENKAGKSLELDKK